MSIVSSLSKLLTKMGGQPLAGDNSDELIEKIADKYTPSGGGGNVLIVRGTVDMSVESEHEQYPMTIDKTLDEIAAAEYSVLIVDMENGPLYELPEIVRSQDEDMLAGVTWGVEIAGMMGFIAVFQIGDEGNYGFFEMIERDSPILTVHPVLGTGDENEWPVTSIGEAYDEIDDADMAYAAVYASDLGITFKLPLVAKQTTPNYAQLIFSASSGNSTARLILSFSASTHEFDASASAFTVE